MVPESPTLLPYLSIHLFISISVLVMNFCAVSAENGARVLPVRRPVPPYHALYRSEATCGMVRLIEYSHATRFFENAHSSFTLANLGQYGAPQRISQQG